MNRYNGNKSQIIELMKKHNTNVADEIQEKMYDFDSLIKQTDETLTLLLNDIPDELWTMSLKGVNSEFLARVLGALPKRLA